MIKSVFRYVILLLTIFVLLQINGVNVSSMLAGVGILSIIIGFAVQDVLKYMINTCCNPLLKVQMKRNVLRCVLLGLAENNIQVLYNQIDVHTK